MKCIAVIPVRGSEDDENPNALRFLGKKRLIDYGRVHKRVIYSQEHAIPNITAMRNEVGYFQELCHPHHR